MATNLSIDPSPLEKAFEFSGEQTRKAAVGLALREFVARRERMKLRELFGSLEWNPDFDYKRERTRTWNPAHDFFRRHQCLGPRAAARHTVRIHAAGPVVVTATT